MEGPQADLKSSPKGEFFEYLATEDIPTRVESIDTLIESAGLVLYGDLLIIRRSVASEFCCILHRSISRIGIVPRSEDHIQYITEESSVRRIRDSCDRGDDDEEEYSTESDRTNSLFSEDRHK